MKIVCVSDTHCRLSKIDIGEGSVLIHSGDLTFDGSILQVAQEMHQLKKAKNHFNHILFVPGNHDWLFQTNQTLAEEICKDALLHEREVVIDGVKFYGTAWQPEFCGWAYNLDRGSNQLIEAYKRIPNDTNVLITHTPPMYKLDDLMHGGNVGCYDLAMRIKELKQLKIHAFGHIHFSYGSLTEGEITYINSSICDEGYKPINQPIVVTI